MVKLSASTLAKFAKHTDVIKASKKASTVDVAALSKSVDDIAAQLSSLTTEMKGATRAETADGAIAGSFKGLTKDDTTELKTKTDGLKDEKLESPSDIKSASKKLLDNVGTGNLLVAAGLGSALLYFYIRKKVSEDTPRTITKVEMSDSDYKITYTPAINILTTDQVNISGCTVVPDINGNRAVKSAPDDSTIIITGAGTLTALCTSTSCGTINVTSSVYGQLADAVGNLVPSILPDKNVFLTYWWVFLIIALVVCSSSAAAFMTAK